MKELPRFWRFMGSRSGRGFLVHLGVCAALSVAVGCGFYYFSLNWFQEHKSSEKITALQLVDAFVTNYSALRSQLGSNAPVPASFRAHASRLSTSKTAKIPSFVWYRSVVPAARS
jgi:hypothetical protein